MSATRLKLAEIISARLCHDLAGPVGTLAATLEMVGDGSADAAEALEIASDAARALQSRLRFIRAAWAVDGAELDADAILGYCSALPQARKVSFHFDGLLGSFDPAMSRGLLNLAMLAVESLPRGGAVTLSGDQDQGVTATITGTHAAWPPGFAALAKDEAAAWQALRDSRSLQGPLTALILHQGGISLRFLGSGGDAALPAPLLMTRG